MIERKDGLTVKQVKANLREYVRKYILTHSARYIERFNYPGVDGLEIMIERIVSSRFTKDKHFRLKESVIRKPGDDKYGHWELNEDEAWGDVPEYCMKDPLIKRTFSHYYDDDPPLMRTRLRYNDDDNDNDPSNDVVFLVSA